MTKSPKGAARRHRLVAVLTFLVIAAITSVSPAAASTPSPLAFLPPQRATATLIPMINISESRVGSYTVSVQPSAFGGRTIILGAKATKRIIQALAAGGTGVAAITCQAVAPADLKPYCGTVVAMLAGLGAVGETGDRCLSITLTLGVPPVRVSLVPCPVGDPTPVPVPDLFDPAPTDPNIVAPAPVPALGSSPGIFSDFESSLTSL